MAALGAAVEKALWEVHQLERTVQNVTDVSAPLMAERINAVAARLADVRTAGNQTEVVVPATAVSVVDEGRNPDAYVFSAVFDASAANQATKGRVHSIKELADALAAEALAWQAEGKAPGQS